MYLTNPTVRNLGEFLNEEALQAAHPASANAGNTALVGSAPPYVRYCSNGDQWVSHDVGPLVTSTTYSAGALVGFVSAGVTYSVSYDGSGRPSSITSNGVVRTISYNPDGTVSSIT